MSTLPNLSQLPDPNDVTPLVGIGGSTGSEVALRALLPALPAVPGMAFIIVLRLAANRSKTLLAQVQAWTALPVQWAEAEMLLLPNQIYLAPPGQSVTVVEQRLQLSPLPAAAHQFPLLDHFFASLATAAGPNAVALLLSGTGQDGVQGVLQVKAQGGLTLAQAPDEATHPALVRRLIAQAQGEHLLDKVAPVAELIAYLLFLRPPEPAAETDAKESILAVEQATVLNLILAQLQLNGGHDLSYYKRSTLLRRIIRRVQRQGLNNLDDYLALLRQNPDEAQALYQECLISVTHFLRDPAAFAALAEQVIPELFVGKKASDTVRVWVVGCATGEEAYSVAMLLRERAAVLADPPQIQVFATDVDEEAVTFARRGLYPATIANQMSQARLQSFFLEEKDGYRVKLELRETVLFAVHNLLKDPPFSQLDLISCRNVLIYLTREAQDKSFALFHYALQREGDNPGYLFLGTSESTDGAAKLFTAVDKRHHLYRRQRARASVARPLPLPLPAASRRPAEAAARLSQGSVSPQTRSIDELYQQWTLRQYAPPRLLVNERYEITHVFNGAGRYLRDPEGEVTHNILQKVLPELRLDLRTALYQAFHTGARTDSSLIAAAAEGETWFVQLHVGSVNEVGFPRELVEVVFTEHKQQLGRSPAQRNTNNDSTSSELVGEVAAELLRTRHQLQTILEVHENSIQEMKVANEELQSINEELKSTGEELETSKEELQSMNEELVTVNYEFKLKIEELARANSDLLNLIASTDVGVIFLDRRLCIKRFTPPATQLFHLLESDLGRPLAHISHRLQTGQPAEFAARVLETLESTEAIIQNDGDRWYILRLFPYRTIDQEIDGVVLTLIDISALKRAESEVQQRIQQQTVAELGRQALRSHDLPQLLNNTAARLVQILDVELCGILAVQDGAAHNELRLVAGAGWPEPLLGQAIIVPQPDSPNWTALRQDEPIVIENIAQQPQYRLSPLFQAQSVVSGVSVVIGGSKHPYGVLGVYSKTAHRFSASDVSFVQSIANLLGEAIARQQTEAALRASEDRFRTLADAPPALVWVSDSAGHNIYMNARWYEYTGQTVAAAQGEGWTAMMHPDDAAAILPYWQQCQQTGEIYQGEVRYRRHDGVYRWHLFRALPQRNAAGEILAWYGCSIDMHEARMAEEARRQSEQRLNLAMHAAQMVNWEWDPVRNQITTTDNFHSLYGLPTIATVEQGFALVHPDDQAAHRAKVDQVSTQGGSYRSEFRIRRPDDGREAWLEEWGYGIAGADGQVEKLVAVVRDSTERRQIEEALGESEARLNTILQNLPAAVYLMTPDHRYLYVNRYYEQDNQITNAEICGQSVFDRFSPAEAAHLAANEQRVLASRTAVAFEETVLRDGEKRHYATIKAPLLDAVGQPAALVGISLDITARKAAEEALRQSEVRFRTLANAMPQLVWTSDFQGKVDYYNVRVKDYDPAVRLPEGDFDWARFVHPDDLDATLVAWQAAAEQGTGYAFEHRLRMADGSWRWHLSLAMPMETESGQLKWYGTATDIHERKAAEATLRQQAELLDQAHDAMIVWELGGAIRYWNRGAVELYGWSQQEALGRVTHELLQTQHMMVTAEFEEMLRANGQWMGEVRHTTRSGQELVVESRYAVVRQADDLFLVLETNRDITDRKQNEERLAFNSYLLENMQDAVIAFDANYVVTAWNRGAELLYGYSATEALGRSVVTLVNPTVTSEQRAARVERMNRTGHVRVETVHHHRNGQPIAIEAVSIILGGTDSSNRSYLTINRDVSERKQAEQALRRQEEFVRLIADNVPALVGYVGADERYRFVNATFEAWFQRPRQQIVGSTVSSLLGEAERARLSPPRQQALAGEIVTYETIFSYPDGVTREIWGRYQPDVDPAGTVLGFYVFVMDISERKQAEAALQQLNLHLEHRIAERTRQLEEKNRELERSNRELDQFAYVASHDLKSPLRAIDNLSQWISQDAAAQLPPASQTHLQKLRGRVRRMERLLDDLLLFSRAGRIRRQPEWVDTAVLVQNVIELLTPPAGFQITLDEPMPKVRTERVPLETVLRNLVGNAIKHHHRAVGQVQVAAKVTANRVEFTVSDDGPGIEPHYHHKIFEVFQTLKPRDQVEGSGMGLAVVKKLVESYGGLIEVESTPGQGTTFRFTWPHGDKLTG